MTQNTPKILVITGPTATGKTALSIALAQELGGEIVSADSMQVYRGMNIGTAKVKFEEMCGIAHHMLDVADPCEPYSAARYVQDASACVDGIINRGKLPIVVGGTGLYIDSLISGGGFAGGEPSQELRQELNEKFEQLGGKNLLEELRRVDPERAARLHPSDSKRIVRALEVFYATGKPISEHDEETRSRPPRYDACIIALSFKDRQDLYDRIDSRVEQMAAVGLVQEVEGLLAAGLSSDCTAMQAIGYKEIAAFLDGKISLDEAIEKIKQESRRYAKRQLTWLRRNPKINWILWDKTPDFAGARQSSTKFLSKHGLE